MFSERERNEMIAWLEKQGEQPKKHDVCDNCEQQGSCVSPCPMKLVEKHGEQNNAWSEEDELITNKILCICSDFERSFEISPASTKVIKEDVDKIDNWLKSLKERYTWKPNEVQMKALEHAINCYSGISPTNTEEVYTLEIMREQLKKLMEE